MKNILIITATSGNNKNLAYELKNILDQLNAKSSILNLEDYELPLYKPGSAFDLKQVSPLHEQFINSGALIFCAPEYNGGLPPVLSNAVAWLSVSSANWRECFDQKFTLLTSFSGGSAFRFLSEFRLQLEYLGSIVYPRTISVSLKNPLKHDSVRRILKKFLKCL